MLQQHTNRSELQPLPFPAQSPQQTHSYFFFLQGFAPAPFYVTGPPGPITVALGEDVVLPCHFFPEQSSQDMEVMWFREQFSPFVHRYKEGQDQYGEQMLQYQGRTELLKDGFASGNVDLKIFRVQLSDRGRYTCFVRHDSVYDEAVVELKVTDPFFHNARPWMTAVGVILVAVVALLVVALYLLKIKGKHEKRIALQEAALRHRDAAIEKQAEELGECSPSSMGDFSAGPFPHLGFAPWRCYAVPMEEAKVVLDPDTAHHGLVLSDDCKSVKRGDTWQNIPDIPQRFNPRSCVLGREGFTSGRHYWEVETVDGGGWTVGVCREDVENKNELEFKPEEGIWAVGKWAGHLRAFTAPERTLLPEVQPPKRIRVSLDYEGGRVAFFSVDEGIPIFTFPLTSFEGVRVHPWVWLGPGTWLKMCP
ncbi:butyrophilin subfamily 1 member A1-like [Aegotheles albertisi]